MEKKISTALPVVVLDNKSIAHGSFEMPDVPASFFRIDEPNATLYWLQKPDFDSLVVKYRVLPFRWTEPKYHFSFDSIRNNFFSEKTTYAMRLADFENKSLFNFKGFSSEGSIGRSFTIGNNQDAVLNSSLNLQLSGYIADSIQLTAAITDNNIPFQPEGNTQDLRDFDRVFLQLGKKNWQLSMGDISIKQTKRYFLGFNKRLQGFSFETKLQQNKDWKSESLVSGAVAKGKFFKNIISAQESNQGPYRLRGANNELYFVVLAGSERVFIDGVLMIRGDDQDYVINYNTAEITFTPRQLINRDKRIQVEFEYADRNYLNTQFFVDQQLIIGKKLDVGFSAFLNTDAKNTTIDQPLTDDQKQILSKIGDSLDLAVVRTAIKDSFSLGKVLYRLTDTVFNNGLHDSVFVLSNIPNDDLYNVTFNYVGKGKGNYRQLLNGNNVKVFEWIAPGANGARQGDFEPVNLLVTPKQQQIYNLSIGYKLSEHSSVKSDWALSHYDVNLFSVKHTAAQNGLAGKITWNHESDSFRVLRKKYKWFMNAGAEWVQRSFKALERLRTIEFLRDWGLPFEQNPADETLLSFSTALTGKNNSLLKYEVVQYRRSDGYRGMNHSMKLSLNARGWELASNNSLLLNSAFNQNGSFFRPIVDLKKILIKSMGIQAGFNFTGEYNYLKDKTTDTFSIQSFAFSRYETFVKSDPAKPNKWSLTYFMRENKYPFKQQLLRSDRSDNYVFAAEFLKNENHQAKLSASYRNLQYYGSFIGNKKNDESIAGRAEYNFYEWKGMLTGAAFYEIGGGQEQKREFSYLSVPAGTGQFTWNDYNGNGIEELNEFETALFQDQKKYIRIFSPTNQYVKSRFLQCNGNVDVDPGRRINKKNGFLAKWLSKSFFSSSFQISKKLLATEGFLFDPFSRQRLDSGVVALANTFSNAYFYNRSGSRWGFDLTHNLSVQRSLLTYGFELKKQEMLTGKLRWNINRGWLLNISIRKGLNVLSTDGVSFVNRNYDISNLGGEPSITYLRGNKWRSTVSVSYSKKMEQTLAFTTVLKQTIQLENKYNGKRNSSLLCRFSYQHLNEKGNKLNPNSTIAFIMFEGLTSGKNYLWNLDYTKRLQNNLEISLQYEGRKTEASRIINTGRASVRALF